jgi:hypothetical protein
MVNFARLSNLTSQQSVTPDSLSKEFSQIVYSLQAINSGLSSLTTLVVETLNATTSVSDNGKRVFSSSSMFQSAETAFPTAAGITNFAHGLGVVPVLWFITIRNVTTELGYSVNDEELLGPVVYPGVTGNRFTAGADATNVFLISESNGSTSILRKDTQVLATITKANWKVIVRAWA